MAFVLFIFGALFAFLFVFNGLIQSLRGNVRIGFWATFFVFAATLITVGAVITTNLGDFSWPMIPPIPQLVMGLGASLAIVSIVLVLLDSRRSEYRFRDARGLLGIGAGVLMVASTFLVPFLSTDVLPIPTVVAVDISSTLAVLSTQAANAENASESAAQSINPAGGTSTPRVSAVTLTPTRTPSPTRTPRAEASLTLTRSRYVSPTPTLTPTFPNPCLVLVNFNLNLRAEPNSEASVLAVIPFDTSVPSFAKDDSGTWWQVTYEDQVGWVDQQYITLSSSCEDLPVRE